MKVSLIIPVHQVETYIEACLLSALKQTHDNLEIILVDDCGRDDSIPKAKKVIAAHPRGSIVSIIEHDRNLGVSAARNNGLLASSGEYIFFLDSDDEITPDAIEKLAAYVGRYGPVDWVHGTYYSEEGKSAVQLPPDLKEFYDTNEAIKEVILKDKITIAPWNKLIKRDFLLSNNLFFKEGIRFEDDHWNWFVAKKIGTMAVCREVTYLYNDNPSGFMLNPYDENKAQDRFFILRDFVEHMDDVGREFQVEKIYRNSLVFLTEIRNNKALRKRYKKKVIGLISGLDRRNLPLTIRLSYLAVKTDINLYVFLTKVYAGIKRI